jgi:Carboxypeptidase regulatory-like domain
VAGATVTAVPVPPAEAATVAATADASGRFTLRRLQPGTYTLTAQATDYGTSSLGVIVVASEVTPAAPIILDYLFGSLSGTVRSSFDQSPLAGATVTAQNPSFGDATATTGGDGTFSFAKLRVGRYALRAEQGGYFAATGERDVLSHETANLTGVDPDPVVRASVSVDPTTYTGSCPAVFTFTGTISSAVAGTVTYRWLRSDGATAPVETIAFAEPGTQTVTTTWTLSPATFNGWQRLSLISPTSAVSNQANFTLTCTQP